MLDRIETHNPVVNCYLDVFAQQALETAEARDRELDSGKDRGPLHGIPVAIKDIFDFPGHRASGGSRIERPALSAPPTVVSRLEAAGAVILGTLNLDELAAGGTGDNAHFGRCTNPWDPARVCGGSSGGSAAALAAGLAYAAIGSDAGGSVRIPAAFCGVVGTKPTYGRVSRAGALARTWSMDCIGPLTRSVADAAIMLDAISGEDDFDPSTVPSLPVVDDRGKLDGIQPSRIGVCELPETVTDGLRNTQFDSALARLEDAGYRLHPVSIPQLDRYTEMQQIIVKSEGAAMHETSLRNPDSAMSYPVRSVIEGGLEIPAIRYIEALSLREPLLRDFCESIFSDCDVLAMPVSMPAAPVYAPQNELQSEAIDRAFSQLATMTRFANYLGIPALSIPTGIDENGLPGAIQFIGRPFDESAILRVATSFEQLRGPIDYPLQQSLA